MLTTRIAWLIQTGQRLARRRPRGHLHQQGGEGDADAARRRCCRSTRAACGSAPSTACATACCARTTAKPGLPQAFQILDSQDQLARDQAADRRRMNVDEERFPPRELQWFIAGAKEEGLRAERRRGRATTSTRRMVELYAAVRRAVPARRRGRFRRAAAAHATSCCATTRSLREHYQRRFRHILVDEFQDTNALQYALAEAARRPAGTARVFAVGDDDQSIYAFRGAHVGNMADFEREFQVRQRDQAGAELPLARQHPRRRQRADRQQPQRAWARTCGPTAGQGEPVRVFEAPVRHRRGAAGSSRKCRRCARDGTSRSRDRGAVPLATRSRG